MKYKFKFEIHLSTNEVQFFNITVSLKHGKLRTTLFTKPTDSYFSLNTLSCHPPHALKNRPKQQLRLRGICSEISGYLFNTKIMCKKMIEHGFHEKELKI